MWLQRDTAQTGGPGDLGLVCVYVTIVAVGWKALTVCSNQGLDALPAPLAQPVDHEEQQREDEERGDTADDQAHPTSH